MVEKNIYGIVCRVEFASHVIGTYLSFSLFSFVRFILYMEMHTVISVFIFISFHRSFQNSFLYEILKKDGFNFAKGHTLQKCTEIHKIKFYKHAGQ